jgi:hypothetical protein
MDDRGAGAQDGGGEQERARRHARQQADPAFRPAFAAHLELRQVEAARQRRAEQQVEVRRHAADRAAVGPEEEDDRLLHAARLRSATRAGISASSACTPSEA